MMLCICLWELRRLETRIRAFCKNAMHCGGVLKIFFGPDYKLNLEYNIASRLTQMQETLFSFPIKDK